MIKLMLFNKGRHGFHLGRRPDSLKDLQNMNRFCSVKVHQQYSVFIQDSTLSIVYRVFGLFTITND